LHGLLEALGHPGAVTLGELVFDAYPPAWPVRRAVKGTEVLLAWRPGFAPKPFVNVYGTLADAGVVPHPPCVVAILGDAPAPPPNHQEDFHWYAARVLEAYLTCAAGRRAELDEWSAMVAEHVATYRRAWEESRVAESAQLAAELERMTRRRQLQASDPSSYKKALKVSIALSRSGGDQGQMSDRMKRRLNEYRARWPFMFD
jgi:hypothetical protein